LKNIRNIGDQKYSIIEIFSDKKMQPVKYRPKHVTQKHINKAPYKIYNVIPDSEISVKPSFTVKSINGFELIKLVKISKNVTLH